MKAALIPMFFVALIFLANYSIDLQNKEQAAAKKSFQSFF